MPLIVRWDGKVREGSVSDHISAFWDFMPTFAEAIGSDVPEGTDGVSFLPELSGEGEQAQHEYLYWEFHELGGRQAVRCGDWKAVVNNISAGRNVELYNLAEDPSETENLAGGMPELAARMDSVMRASHTPSESFPFPGD